MNSTIKYFFLAIGISLSFIACEREITIDLPQAEDQIVVEGWIESDEYPFVLLTRNLPFFGSIDTEDLGSIFVEGATVTVFNGTDTMQLEEYTLDTLGQSATAYGPAFIDILTGKAFKGERGKTYNLNIEAEGKTLSSKTIIPNGFPMDSIWWEPRQDTMARVFVNFSDPDTVGNYYRYFTQIGDEPMYPGFTSVFDDLLVNGQTFVTPVDRGYDRFGDIDFETIGLYPKGDTITIRIAGIDEAHYNFWQTMESNSQSGGPFSPIIVVDHNIEGGFGIWGGYAVQELSIYIPE